MIGVCLGKDCLKAGVDEAGRGCVIGPMVMAIAAYVDEPELKQKGVKDSKLLSPRKRVELFDYLKDICHHQVSIVSALELNELMKIYSLNEIEAMKTAELLRGLPSNVDTVFIDSPDSIPSKYRDRIIKYFGSTKLNIVSENKADLYHPIVGAASIFAKVTRDAEIEKIKIKTGLDFGSGYSSDAKAVNCLRDNLQNKLLLNHVRLRWKTYTNLADQSNQQTLF